MLFIKTVCIFVQCTIERKFICLYLYGPPLISGFWSTVAGELEFLMVSQYSSGLFSSHTRLDAEVGDFLISPEGVPYASL